MKNLKSFIDYSQTIDDVCQNLRDCNPTKKNRVLIVFDNMIADMESNKTSIRIITELSLRAKRLHISPGFTSPSGFKVPKTIRLNSTYYFIMKISNVTSSNSL